MMESPRSLTATIHVRFHYREEPEPSQPSERAIEMVNSILERASELEPDLLEMLLKFASYLNTLGPEKGGQSPA